MSNIKKADWILRVATSGSFIGHGAFALQGKEGWFKYFEAVGINNPETIVTLLFLIGIMDLTLALLLLVKPMRAPMLWMAFWGLWTALLRWPIGPDPIWDFVERWANWGAPLALLFLHGWPKKPKDWLK